MGFIEGTFMHKKRGTPFACRLTRDCCTTACSLCLAAIVVIGLGDAAAEARGQDFSASHIELANERRPGLDADARRRGIDRAFPETERDRQRPGYRPGYRPGAFERHAPRDCPQDRRSGSRRCR